MTPWLCPRCLLDREARRESKAGTTQEEPSAVGAAVDAEGRGALAETLPRTLGNYVLPPNCEKVDANSMYADTAPPAADGRCQGLYTAGDFTGVNAGVVLQFRSRFPSGMTFECMRVTPVGAPERFLRHLPREGVGPLAGFRPGWWRFPEDQR